MKKIVYILFFVFGNLLIAQNESFNWYFGSNSAISFSTFDGEPKVVSDAVFYSFEGCSSISDSAGNLLFYTNGKFIYNNKHQIINKNNPIHSDNHSTQSALIIKQPNSNDIFYLFTTDAGLYADSVNYGLNYTLVKSDIFSTQILSINNSISLNMTEKLTACFHENGKDVWVISHLWNSNSFISLLLTENGIESKVMSNSGTVQNGDSNAVIGYMKVSPDGSKLALNCVTKDYAELFSFDNLSGKVSNDIKISLGNRIANYGLEFSPTGKYLYICDANEGLISQFNVSEMNSSKIALSEKIIAKEKNDLGALQIAPNGKIYVANLNSPFISEIKYPDKEGDLCDYQSLSFKFAVIPENYCSYGLPNFNQGLFDFNLKLEKNNYCVGENVVLKLKKYPKFKNTKYKWTGVKGFTSNTRELNLLNAKIENSGWYYLHADYLNFSKKDSIFLTISELPECKITMEGDLAVDGFIILKSKIKNSKFHYLWSNGDNTDEITVQDAAKYFLTITNENGCSSTDSIEISSIKEAIKFLKPDSKLFDEICIGGFDIKDIKIENTGKHNILINDIVFTNGGAEFQILNKNQIIGSINSGTQKLIRLRFYTGKPGIYSHNLQISTSFGNENQTFDTDIKGDAKAEIELWVPEVSQDAGQKLDIPIFAKMKCYEGVPLRTDLKLTLRFNKDTFYPYTSTSGEFSKYLLDSFFVVHINLKNLLIQEGQTLLTQINGSVLTGNFEPDSLFIDSVIISEDNVEIAKRNGLLTVTGCASFLRPVMFSNKSTVSISPQPANNVANFTFHTKEQGEISLEIFSIEGRLIFSKSFIKQNFMFESIQDSIDLEDFSEGIYSVIVKFPEKIIHKNLVIEKK